MPSFSIKSTILSILSEHSKDLEKSCTHVEILEQIDVVPPLKRSIMGRDILDRYNVELSGTEKEITLTRNKFGDGTYKEWGRKPTTLVVG